MLSFFTYLVQSVVPTVKPVVRLVSIAYWSTAPSIMRRSLRILVACERLRARRNPGTAIAASKAMIATTIIISTSVKPALFADNFFDIINLSLLIGYYCCELRSSALFRLFLTTHSLPLPLGGYDRRMNRQILVGRIGRPKRSWRDIRQRDEAAVRHRWQCVYDLVA